MFYVYILKYSQNQNHSLKTMPHLVTISFFKFDFLKIKNIFPQFLRMYVKEVNS